VDELGAIDRLKGSKNMSIVMPDEIVQSTRLTIPESLNLLPFIEDQSDLKFQHSSSNRVKILWIIVSFGERGRRSVVGVGWRVAGHWHPPGGHPHADTSAN
jgi:hypothetical protein